MKKKSGKIYSIIAGIFIVLALVFVAFIVSTIFYVADVETGAGSESVSSLDGGKAENSSEIAPSAESGASSEDISTEQKVYNNQVLDANYSNLLLVNGKNPLPDDYDYEANLVTIESKYLNGDLTQIKSDVYPYLMAMVEDAWADGVELYVRSPYRSYSIQNRLFENETQKWINTGMDRTSAENKASTIVARPGTSEHNTGLAVDFNVAADLFETKPMYTWLCENAEDYGFIMRYSEEKQPITGVIKESWHWRFVGIKTAKEINKKGYCLEEYVEYIEKKN